MDAEIKALEQKRDKDKAIKQELLMSKTRLIDNRLGLTAFRGQFFYLVIMF